MTVLHTEKVQHKIRPNRKDVPERAQRFGTKSRENLAGKVFGEVVRVDVVGVDRYRCEVGRIDHGDCCIDLEQIRDGFAWRDVRDDKPGALSNGEKEGHQR